MRILLCPVEIAGYMGRLKAGLIEQGCEARFIDLGDNAMRYQGCDPLFLTRAYAKVRSLFRGRNRLARIALAYPAFVLLRIALFTYSLVWPDVIVFCFGKTLLGGWEVPIYKALKKRLVFIYLGSDSRPAYLNGASASAERGISQEECYQRAMRQKRRIAWLDRYADFIIDHPPSGIFHERPFVPFLRIGMPAPDIRSGGCIPQRGITTILHAPSFPECKGTPLIREMISTLSSQGRQINYVELIGKTNAEVLDELSKCSFVIDELYSDSVLAGLGTEAAMMGKATLVGSYADPDDFFTDSAHLPPAIVVRPEALFEKLQWMLDSPDAVAAIGEAAHDFVSRHWRASEVAYRFIEMLDGNIPTAELCDPSNIKRTMGWGFPEHRLRDFMKEYIKRHGRQGLFLDDKPILRNSLEAMTKGGEHGA